MKARQAEIDARLAETTEAEKADFDARLAEIDARSVEKTTSEILRDIAAGSYAKGKFPESEEFYVEFATEGFPYDT